MFYYSGKQKNATGAAGTVSGNINTDEQIYGIDFSGKFPPTFYWFGQFLWNEWDGFINTGTNYKWNGALIGLDYNADNNWTYSHCCPSKTTKEA